MIEMRQQADDRCGRGGRRAGRRRHRQRSRPRRRRTQGAPPSGASADAVAAALAATGGGKANAVELDDEKGAVWEVEVTRADGWTVDVRLDGAYKVVAIDGDGETEAGGDR